MAATTSKEYWECRSAERMIDYTAEAEKTANKIGKAYLNAGKYLSDEAGKVVKSFGKAFDLNEAEALRLLKNPSGKSMVQQLKAAVSGVSDPDKRKELEKMISSPAYTYRIGRLEDVEKNIRDSCAKLYNTELKADESFFRSLPITAYERTIFDVQKAIGISSSFAQFPESRINRILSTKWSGEHFSERVWGNTNALANDLQHDMLVGIMAGKSEVHMADDIMARMGGGAYAARRVVRTETNYIANQAELDGYKECGLEKYEFSAHLDNRTSEICAEMDGKVFALKDAQAGTNLPPMHPFCRSSTIPVLPSEEELDRIIQQDGDAIGADVDFEKWKSHLVENEDGKLVYRVDNSAESGIINIGSENTDALTIENNSQIKNHNVYTGVRSEIPLTQQEKDEVISYFKKFDLDRIYFSDYYSTVYNERTDGFIIGTDVKPLENPRVGTLYANQRVSLKSALAHEIVGHREAHLKGFTQRNSVYEEVQASIRAARFAPDLTDIERITLLRDARARLGKTRLKDIKNKLFIEEE